jgi:hypothetical protein
MAKLTPQQMAAKWQRNYSGSTEAMKQGVQAVTINPAQKAIDAGERYIAGVQAAFQSGKWAAGLAKVTLADWKTAYIEKGIANAAAGARAGATKFERHEREFGPVRDQIVASLPPRGTLEENLQRSNAMARGMYEARRRG